MSQQIVCDFKTWYMYCLCERKTCSFYMMKTWLWIGKIILDNETASNWSPVVYKQLSTFHKVFDKTAHLPIFPVDTKLEVEMCFDVIALHT
jgi:hypothetical protein